MTELELKQRLRQLHSLKDQNTIMCECANI